MYHTCVYVFGSHSSLKLKIFEAFFGFAGRALPSFRCGIVAHEPQRPTAPVEHGVPVCLPQLVYTYLGLFEVANRSAFGSEVGQCRSSVRFTYHLLMLNAAHVRHGSILFVSKLRFWAFLCHSNYHRMFTARRLRTHLGECGNIAQGEIMRLTPTLPRKIQCGCPFVDRASLTSFERDDLDPTDECETWVYVCIYIRVYHDL